MSNQPAQPIATTLQQYAAQVQQSPCPWCRQKDWDSGVAVLAPIILDQASFDTDAPYQNNALLSIIVFRCQQCSYALTFAANQLPAPRASTGASSAQP